MGQEIHAETMRLFLMLKVWNLREEKCLEETLRTDLSHIEEKQLKERGIPKKHILSFGFAFEGKKVLIAGSKMRTIIVYGG